jgi:HSP20 family protein
MEEGLTMNVKKWIPWNWFKKEEEEATTTVPVQRPSAHEPGLSLGNSLAQFHREFDRLFDQAFRGFDRFPSSWSRPLLPHMNGSVLKPTLDLSATDKEYAITLEIPGVDEKDVRLEIVDDTLTIQGEKKQENEQKSKDFYRMERSYGSFRRVLSLPQDADQEHVKATFMKGVLTVTLPRRALPKSDVKQIEVKSA